MRVSPSRKSRKDIRNTSQLGFRFPAKRKRTVVRQNLNKADFKRKVFSGVKIFFWKLLRSIKLPIVFVLLILCLVGFGVFKIIKDQYFAIKQIEIIGNSIVETSALQSLMTDASGRWIFLLAPGSLESKIYSSSNYIKSAYIEKVLPDKLILHIEERVPIAVWRTVNGAYLIDADGFVIERTLNSEVSLEKVLSEVSIPVVETPVAEDDQYTVAEFEEDFEESEIGEENSETEDNAEKLKLEEVLDAETLAAMQLELETIQKEQNLLNLNFDTYNQIPDNFKKYPQVKMLTDDVFEVSQKIPWELWGGYSSLLANIAMEKSLKVKEILIFSENKVVCILESGIKVYFRIDDNIATQVKLFVFVYSRLLADGTEFTEIDLRFKRPVIRK